MTDSDTELGREAAEEVCRYINGRPELKAEARRTGEDVSVDIDGGGFLDPQEIHHIRGLGFAVDAVYPFSESKGHGTAVIFRAIDGEGPSGAIDHEKIQRRAKRAMKGLVENDPTHNIELDLQHIWVAAGGETGEPGAEEYMSELYPH